VKLASNVATNFHSTHTVLQTVVLTKLQNTKCLRFKQLHFTGLAACPSDSANLLLHKYLTYYCAKISCFFYNVMGINKQIIIPIIYHVHSRTGILFEIHFHPYILTTNILAFTIFVTYCFCTLAITKY